jgi:cold shock CspA family protein
MFGTGRGVVEDFDEARGLGTIRDGEMRLPFHCTALLDGTRTIEVGSVVSYEVAAGRLGRWEAMRVARRS